MPESKKVQFDTKFKANTGTSTLVISMQRSINFANVLDSEVNLKVYDEFINNKQIAPGELVLTLKNGLRDIDAFIDNDSGNLVISSEDSKNYSLNSQGHLIYTYR